MFEDDENPFEFGDNLKEDLEQFEEHLKGKSIGFLDSDRLEAIIDHYLITAQYNKAKRASELGMYQFSYNPLFNLRYAQSLSGMGNLQDALQQVNILEKSAMSNPEVLLTKASVFSQLRDHKNAIRYFKLALDICEIEDRDEIYLDISMEYQNLRQFKEAISILKEALRANPANEGALYELAYCYDQTGAYDQAVNTYQAFIDEYPYSFTAWYNLGNAYSKVENHEKALWAYDYSLLINEEFGPAHFNIGNAYLHLEKYHKAIEHFHRCMELDGDDPLALCYIGEAHEQLEEFELAKHFYRRSIELAPMLSEAWLGLGIVEDLLENTREAIVLIRKALEFDEQNPGIYHVLAGAYEKLGEIGEALDNYEESLILDTENKECVSDYHDCLVNLLPLEALERLNSLELNVSNNFHISLLQVAIFVMAGKREIALNIFRDLAIENNTKAKTLFEISPSLLDEAEFVNLVEI